MAAKDLYSFFKRNKTTDKESAEEETNDTDVPSSSGSKLSGSPVVDASQVQVSTTSAATPRVGITIVCCKRAVDKMLYRNWP
ncbi:hypothetical protein HOLleu_03368 [Holothuria leucospilota]|uniref:Uncharacterized protein n=1 Tax=Holothuria leucospilota TaxID=206669 RepID=A0A9Q1CSX7_HOLLE|nr:hypothetical protein HOLleu_03368 [Holothuria leucospilota]